MNPQDVLDGIVQALHDPGVRYVAQVALNTAVAYANLRQSSDTGKYLVAAMMPSVLTSLAEVPFAAHPDAGKIFGNIYGDIAAVEATATAIHLGPLVVRDVLKERRGRRASTTLDSPLDPRLRQEPADE